jgi:hypothetical protein
MHLIENTPDTNYKKISICIDNQALIKSTTRPKAVSEQYLLQHLSTRANNSRAKINIKWISSHSGVSGNEKADKLAKERAKEAGEGRASRKADLPPILRKPVPINASASKQEYLAHLKRAWKGSWLHLPRKGKIERLDDSFPFNSYRERQDKLSRLHASSLMQLRSGHLPLNFYLYRIKKSETKNCRACRPEPGDEALKETISHFLYDCEAYTIEPSLTRNRNISLSHTHSHQKAETKSIAK